MKILLDNNLRSRSQEIKNMECQPNIKHHNKGSDFEIEPFRPYFHLITPLKNYQYNDCTKYQFPLPVASLSEKLSYDTKNVIKWFEKLTKTVYPKVTGGLSKIQLHSFLLKSVHNDLRLCVSQAMKSENKDLKNPILWSQYLLEIIYDTNRLRADLRRLANALQHSPQSVKDCRCLVKLHLEYQNLYATPDGYYNIVLSRLSIPCALWIEDKLREQKIINAHDSKITEGITLTEIKNVLVEIMEALPNHEFMLKNTQGYNISNTSRKKKHAHRKRGTKRVSYKSEISTLTGSLIPSSSVRSLPTFPEDETYISSVQSSKFRLGSNSGATLVLNSEDMNLFQKERGIFNFSRVSSSSDTSSGTYGGAWKAQSNEEIANYTPQIPPSVKLWHSSSFIKKSNDLFVPMPTKIQRKHMAFRHPSQRTQCQSILTREEDQYRESHDLCLKCGNHESEVYQKCIRHPFYYIYYSSVL